MQNYVFSFIGNAFSSLRNPCSVNSGKHVQFDRNMHTILPEFTVTPFIENKTLSVINVRDSEIEMEIQLIYRNDIWLSPAAKEFISEFQI